MIPIDFTHIDYLRSGNLRQQEAYTALSTIGIMDLLGSYMPLLAGTIPLGIDVPGSDSDILCYRTDGDGFATTLRQHFGHYKGFAIDHVQTMQGLATTACFIAHGFTIEVFGQAVPSQEQLGYRHMLVEHRLLEEHGPVFRQQIINLKISGLKTEPAFAQVLGLSGDPYQALLELE
ncbi:DUF4269 domain-containing protein [Cnuella takakiae]|nr:DUF4269 domain-containing protein [Cnuella takakiae]